jgi:hypothetical protein
LLRCCAQARFGQNPCLPPLFSAHPPILTYLEPLYASVLGVMQQIFFVFFVACNRFLLRVQILRKAPPVFIAANGHSIKVLVLAGPHIPCVHNFPAAGKPPSPPPLFYRRIVTQVNSNTIYIHDKVNDKEKQ